MCRYALFPHVLPRGITFACGHTYITYAYIITIPLIVFDLEQIF